MLKKLYGIVLCVIFAAVASTVIQFVMTGSTDVLGSALGGGVAGLAIGIMCAVLDENPVSTGIVTAMLLWLAEVIYVVYFQGVVLVGAYVIFAPILAAIIHGAISGLGYGWGSGKLRYSTHLD
ncbi:MAG: hypothetical protein IPG59_12585 [Candidatus Melainabacteria bacterium]|nr:MAG: hypothetical protein IPG59_12585 [Candidatus Melainabacteria bacterium]